jgi:hypothetical protein
MKGRSLPAQEAIPMKGRLLPLTRCDSRGGRAGQVLPDQSGEDPINRPSLVYFCYLMEMSLFLCGGRGKRLGEERQEKQIKGGQGQGAGSKRKKATCVACNAREGRLIGSCPASARAGRYQLRRPSR